MTVLIADDDRNIVLAASMMLNSEGIDTLSAQSPKAAIEIVQQQDIELALIDMNYCQDTSSGMEGLELISALKKKDPLLPIIVMTGWATITLAVESMRRGASDFIEKPWDNNRLLAIISAQLKLRKSLLSEQKLKAENKLLRQENHSPDTIVSQSKAMQATLETARRVAKSDLTVLITGENGTGKSLLAQYIHQQSKRADKPVLTINMGGISESIFESEIFGHIRGAFTDAKSDRMGRVELAEGGTLFLDEIGNTPLSQQAKLLRLLEEKQFEKLGSSRSQRADIRVISATNADLNTLLEEQGFRRDLLFRLNGVSLHIPPLRERKEDILLLARQFLTRAIRQFDTSVQEFSEAALEALLDYSWPGNIRELHHVVERATLLACGSQIEPHELQLQNYPSVAVAKSPAHTFDLAADTGKPMTLEQMELLMIEQALSKHNGNAEAAAKTLGLSRSAFYRRLDKYGLSG